MAACVRHLCCRTNSNRFLVSCTLKLSSNRSIHAKPGMSLPSVDVYIDTPYNAVNVRDIFKNKKGVLFSVLGAFTPGCSQSHIPEYLENYDKFKAEGYDVLACLAVNDPYVMSAWGEMSHVDGKILMLADMHADFTKSMGMDLDCRHIMGTIRSKRYSIVIDNNVIQGFNGEPDDSGLACLMCIRNLSKKLEHKAGEHKEHEHTTKL